MPNLPPSASRPVPQTEAAYYGAHDSIPRTHWVDRHGGCLLQQLVCLPRLVPAGPALSPWDFHILLVTYWKSRATGGSTHTNTHTHTHAPAQVQQGTYGCTIGKTEPGCHVASVPSTLLPLEGASHRHLPRLSNTQAGYAATPSSVVEAEPLLAAPTTQRRAASSLSRGLGGSWPPAEAFPRHGPSMGLRGTRPEEIDPRVTDWATSRWFLQTGKGAGKCQQPGRRPKAATWHQSCQGKRGGAANPSCSSQPISVVHAQGTRQTGIRLCPAALRCLT